MAQTPAQQEHASLARGASWTLLTNVATLALGWIASIILARELGPSDRGLLGAMVVLVEIGVTVVGLGVPYAITYYGARRVRHRAALIGNLLVFTTVVAIVIPSLADVFRHELNDIFDSTADPRLWVLAASLFPIYLLSFGFSNMLKARQEFRELGVVLIGSRLVSVVATVVLVAGVQWGVAGGARAALANGIRVSWLVARASINYGMREQVGLLVDYGNARLDVLILSTMAPLSSVGQYVVAQFVAEIALLVPNSLGAVLAPRIAASREDRYSSPVMRLNGTLTLVSAVGLAAVGPAIIYYGYGSPYAEAILPFFILLPGMWFLSTSSLARESLRGRGRPGLSSLIALVSVVVTIVLDLALIPPYHAVGGAIASTIAYMIGAATAYITLARLESVSIRTFVLASPREVWGTVGPLLRRR